MKWLKWSIILTPVAVFLILVAGWFYVATHPGTIEVVQIEGATWDCLLLSPDFLARNPALEEALRTANTSAHGFVTKRRHVDQVLNDLDAASQEQFARVFGSTDRCVRWMSGDYSVSVIVY